jgi:hypothetical protein
MSHIKDRLSDYHDFMKKLVDDHQMVLASDVLEMIEQLKDDLEQDEKENGWIPVSERLPEDCVSVNITWVNHKPESYYISIKDVPFTATGMLYDGKWFWYSTVCEDYLREFGRNDMDEVDENIMVIAWKPLPEPYKGD